ncbi:MAG: imidazole glycerol phosphate synthase subunit HisH [Alphaproteobacteria bacterium]|nr:imidazole glycerol phosphate synthase subunit HisH [Alphaproteobacteria bacterium]|tara:strand:- start:374 stop:1003 length:630 start_codon:yes stop_codon:yes gene_type:complete
MIVIIDYGRGNLFSLSQALKTLNKPYLVTDNPDKILSASRLFLPGVGAFGDAMDRLKDRNLIEPIHSAVENGIPLLGICVGCQILLEKSEEFGEHAGLGLIPGKTVRLPNIKHKSKSRVRIPNVGWRALSINSHAPLLGCLNSDDWMYFVHSYAPSVKHSKNIAATTNINGLDVPVAIQSRKILGVQFHPEKSGASGLKLIANFIEEEF